MSAFLAGLVASLERQRSKKWVLECVELEESERSDVIHLFRAEKSFVSVKETFNCGDTHNIRAAEYFRTGVWRLAYRRRMLETTNMRARSESVLTIKNSVSEGEDSSII